MRLSVVLGAIAFFAVGGFVVSQWRDGHETAAAPVVVAASVTLTSSVPSPAATVDGATLDQPNHATPRPAQTFYGRNGREIDLGGVGVAAYVESRARAARMGDLKAVYEVYQALSICANNDDPVADYEQAQQREAFLRERESVKALCTNVSPAQVQERLRFLATAASAGNAAAQIDYYMEGPYGHPFDPAQAEADPLVRQWRDDALGHLSSAAGHCDTFALGLLATVYDAGALTERDMKRSMAYSVAEAAARQVAVSEAALRSRFGSELSGAEFEAARQDGARLARANCGR
jgi:hypothetical protein